MDDMVIKSTEEWTGEITKLEEAKQAMSSALDLLKKSVIDELAAEGISGDLANQIIANYEATVLAKGRDFISEFENYISSNKDSELATEGTIEKITSALDLMR